LKCMKKWEQTNKKKYVENMENQSNGLYFNKFTRWCKKLHWSR
jgi:hypothetical protein